MGNLQRNQIYQIQKCSIEWKHNRDQLFEEVQIKFQFLLVICLEKHIIFLKAVKLALPMALNLEHDNEVLHIDIKNNWLCTVSRAASTYFHFIPSVRYRKISVSRYLAVFNRQIFARLHKIVVTCPIKNDIQKNASISRLLLHFGMDTR